MLRGLQNAHALGNIVLELQVEFTPASTRKLREFFRRFFDEQPAGAEGKALGIETARGLRQGQEGTRRPGRAVVALPFLSALGEAQEVLREATGKPYAWYLQDLGRHEDRLLDLKEGVLDPIRRFMGGDRAIYDDARELSGRPKREFRIWR